MRGISLVLTLISFNALANVQECIGPQGDIGKAMYFSVVEDLGIKPESNKIKAEIVRKEPVTFRLAQVYGKIERKLSENEKGHSNDPTTADEYAQGFMENNAKNLIIQYTFKDKDGKEDVFLASAFTSDVDCIVRFNDYIIVKREW